MLAKKFFSSKNHCVYADFIIVDVYSEKVIGGLDKIFCKKL
jgi:hypothetical protein